MPLFARKRYSRFDVLRVSRFRKSAGSQTIDIICLDRASILLWHIHIAYLPVLQSDDNRQDMSMCSVSLRNCRQQAVSLSCRLSFA